MRIKLLKAFLPASCLFLVSWHGSGQVTSCVNFNSSVNSISLGEFVNFTDLSTKVCSECGEAFLAKSYSWTFEGGNPVTFGEAGPVDIKFVEVGTFDVQLTVTYFSVDPLAKPCVKTVRKENYITVKPTRDVEIESFEANAFASRVKLYWTTIHEKNNATFIVEKSTDGTNYSQVLTVESAGNHSQKTIYSAEDASPAKGESKYRLKKVNTSGESQVIGNLSVQWYDINQALNIAEGERVLVIVEGDKGEEIYSKVIIKDATTAKIFAIDPSQKIKPGTYVIIGSSKNEIYNKTLVIENN